MECRAICQHHPLRMKAAALHPGRVMSGQSRPSEGGAAVLAPRRGVGVAALVVAVVLLAMFALSLLCVLALQVSVTRHRPASLPNAFRCKVAIASRGEIVSYAWPRRTSYAVWVHDVLVVFDGFGRTRIRPLAVHFADGPVAPMVHPASGLSSRPVVMSLELDDGRHALVAASRSARALMAGPFLAALISTDDVAASNERSGD